MLVSSLMYESALKYLLLYKKTVIRKNNINGEIKIMSSQFSYADVRENMKLLAFVTLQFIYIVGVSKNSIQNIGQWASGFS